MRRSISAFVVTNDSVQYTVSYDPATKVVVISWENEYDKGMAKGVWDGGLKLTWGDEVDRYAYQEINNELADVCGSLAR